MMQLKEMDMQVTKQKEKDIEDRKILDYQESSKDNQFESNLHVHDNDL